MCFLKTLKSLDTMPQQKEHTPEDNSQTETIEESKTSTSYLNCMLKSQIPVLVNKQDQMFFDLLSSLKTNNLQLDNMNQVSSK